MHLYLCAILYILISAHGRSFGALPTRENDRCAPAANRTVIVLSRNNPHLTSSLSGENYILNSFVQANQYNGFSVSVFANLSKVPLSDIRYAHRIVFHFCSELMDHCERLQSIDGAICKSYCLAYWPFTVNETGNELCGLMDRQVLTPLDFEKSNTFAGFWPWKALSFPRASAERPAQGLILGKSPDFLDIDQDPNHSRSRLYIKPVIKALLESGFRLFSTCTDMFERRCILPTGVERLGQMSPDSFSMLLRNVSFVLGLYDPADSPTPLEGLASGASFIHPVGFDGSPRKNMWIDIARGKNHSSWRRGQIRRYIAASGKHVVRFLDGSEKEFRLQFDGARIDSSGRADIVRYYRSADLEAAPRFFQHRALGHLGFPYVYNVDLHHPEEVVSAARMASKARFSSYVPWAYTREATVARICRSVLEDETPCQCFGALNEIHEHCHGSRLTTSVNQEGVTLNAPGSWKRGHAGTYQKSRETPKVYFILHHYCRTASIALMAMSLSALYAAKCLSGLLLPKKKTLPYKEKKSTKAQKADYQNKLRDATRETGPI